MDRLTSMAVFTRAVDDGSFAAAARHFGISPEMAGHHVRGLEAHLGVRLLNRTTRRLHLTEAGRQYYARCSRILADVEEAETEAGARQAVPRGLLRVAAPGTFGVLRLAPLIGDYVRLYPEVSVDIVLSDRFVNLIEEGFDVALRIGALPDSSLVARQVSSARLVACAAPAYLQRAGTPEAPADLARHPCLIYAETAAPRLWQFTDAGGRTETVRVSGPVTANGTEFLLRLVLDGHGVMLAPSFLVDAEIAAGRLTPVLTEWRLRDLPVHLLYPHRPLLAAKVRSFIDFLVARLG